jgi:hypothetical protein
LGNQASHHNGLKPYRAGPFNRRHAASKPAEVRLQETRIESASAHRLEAGGRRSSRLEAGKKTPEMPA